MAPDIKKNDIFSMKFKEDSEFVANRKTPLCPKFAMEFMGIKARIKRIIPKYYLAFFRF